MLVCSNAAPPPTVEHLNAGHKKKLGDVDTGPVATLSATASVSIP
jgi:hypothetical protein